MSRFVPRSLEQCQRAVGCVEGLEYRAAFDLGEDLAGGLFHLLSKPKSGDWLATHQEIGQTFDAYAAKMRGMALPRPACGTLLLCPLGSSFDGPLGSRFLLHLRQYGHAFFPGMAVEVLPKILSLKDIKSRENDYGHPQYLIGDIFSMLNSNRDVISKRGSYCTLGVTLEDIYPGDEWNYVFGQARVMERVGVFSFARHSPLFYSGVHALDAEQQLSAAQERTWLRHCRKTMVHEASHMLGILHCIFHRCLMNGYNGPGDSSGASFLCPVCLRKLVHGLSGLWPASLQAIDSRYAAMEELLKETRLEDEAHKDADLEWLAARRTHLAAAKQDKETKTAEPPIPVQAGAGARLRVRSTAKVDSKAHGTGGYTGRTRLGSSRSASSNGTSLRLRSSYGCKQDCDCCSVPKGNISAQLSVRENKSRFR